MNNGKRSLPRTTQIERSGLETRAEAISIPGPGGIAEFGHADGRRNVPFGDTGFRDGPLSCYRLCREGERQGLAGVKQERPGGVQHSAKDSGPHDDEQYIAGEGFAHKYYLAPINLHDGAVYASDET